jgi:hypothetical protein
MERDVGSKSSNAGVWTPQNRHFHENFSRFASTPSKSTFSTLQNQQNHQNHLFQLIKIIKISFSMSEHQQNQLFEGLVKVEVHPILLQRINIEGEVGVSAGQHNIESYPLVTQGLGGREAVGGGHGGRGLGFRFFIGL